MITIAFAVALQSDWGPERALAPEDVEELRRRLDAWGEARGVEAFRDFGRKTRVVRARELPVYRVTATTLDESRSLARDTRPYDGGGPLTRATEDVDLQAPPLPPFEGMESRVWRVPVEGSARTFPCKSCGAAGQVDCARCKGSRRTTCERCRGPGKVDCGTCSGSAKVRCTWCFGFGRSGTGSKRRNCSTCGGDGKVKCSPCESGKVRCGSCRGDGKVDCSACRGRGRQECATCRGRRTLVETLQVAIALRARERDVVVTRCPDPWIAASASVESQVVVGSPEDFRDEAIASTARRLVAETKADVTGRAVRTELAVRRSPVVVATLDWGGVEVEAVGVGDVLHLDPSPAALWAEREAERAEAVFSEDASEAIARMALRADPDNARARNVLARIEVARAVERARRAEESLKGGLLTGLFTVAGLVALTMIGLKIYLMRSRRT